MKFFTSNINKNILVALLAAAFILSLVSPLGTALAQFNPEINYQGKLTDSTGAAVLDGTYNMNFWLVPTSGGATSTAVWSEARTGANRVQVTNGLFSVMLGDVSSLAGVDFNQTLYLAVEIGGTGTPVWDGELLPRKILGAVPAAFVAETANSADALSGIASSSFLRSDEVDTMTASSSSSLLTLVQNGVGKVLSLFSGATEIFTALSNGNIGIGTTTPSQRLSVGATTGSQFLVSSTGVVSDGTWNADAIGATYGGTGLTTVNQNQLLIGGAGNTWSQVATSSLGLYGVLADSITSAQLLNSVSNETGTGALVFGTSPTFTTQITAPLLVGGTAASSNLSLKSTSGVGTTDYIRFLVGNNGATEAMRIISNGNVGIGTTTPLAKLSVDGFYSQSNAYTIKAFAPDNIAQYANMRPDANLLFDTTKPVWALSINNGNDQYAVYRADPTAGAPAFSQFFTINSTGNVGVGTSSPSQKFSVGSTTGSQFLVSSTGVVTDGTWNADVIGGAYGGTGLSSVTQNQLLIGGAGNTWSQVATSSLGLSASFSTSAQLAAILSDEVGTGGGFVRASSTMLTSPTLITPALGTPSSGVLTNATGLPVSTGIAGLGTGVATFLATPSSANLISAVTDETGTGALVFANSPTLTGTLSGASATFSGTIQAPLLTPGRVIYSTTDSYITDDADFVFDGTNLGVGSTTPSSRLTVSGNTYIGGDLRLTGAFRDSSNAAGTAGYVLQTTGSGTQWVATSSLGFTSGATTFLGLTDTPSSYTANRIMYTNSGATALTDTANFVFDGTNLGVGTSTPNNLIQVYDLIEFDNTDFGTQLGYQAGKNLVTGAQYSTFLGYQAGYSSSTGSTNGADYNVGVGYQSLYGNASGIGNTAIGNHSLFSNTSGYFNVANGGYSLYSNTTGLYNTAIGHSSLYTNTGGYGNTATGFEALYANTTGNHNSAYGRASLYANTTGSNNTASGYVALGSNTTGSNNTASGHGALGSNTTGSNNTASGYYSSSFITDGVFNASLGYEAGRYLTDDSSRASTTDYSIYIGASTKALTANDQNTIVIGYNANGIGSNSVVLGNDSITTTALKGNVGIGTTTPGSKLTVAGDTYIGGNLNFSNSTSSGAGVITRNGTRFLYDFKPSNGGDFDAFNIFLGRNAGNFTMGSSTGEAEHGTENIGIGEGVLRNNVIGAYNTAVGHFALLENTTGYYNSAFGRYALVNNTTGVANTGLGAASLSLNITGNDNTAVGAGALDSADASLNTAVGRLAGADITSGGLNTLLGWGTGAGITTGEKNTIIGANISGLSSSLSNNIIIADGDGNQRINVGSTGNVGLGTSTASSRLTVAGDIFATGAFRDSSNASGTLGMVLQSTGTSTRWVATSTLGITGGGGSSLFTDAGATTYLTATGDNLGIGTTTAGSRLTVDGDINLTGAIKFNNQSAIKYQSGNVVFGEYALPTSNSNIYSNTVLGDLSGNNLVSGSTNVFVGFYTGRSLSTSTNNVVIGTEAVGERDGGTEIGGSVIIGRRAGYNLEGNYYHTFIGDAAGENVTTGGENTLIGNQAGSSITTGDGNIVLGSWSTTGITTGNNNVVIGNAISGLSSSLSNNIIIADGQGNRRINVDSSGYVGIGTTTQSSRLTVAGDIFATGAFRDSTNASGTLGMVLQSTGSGTQWVATSTLGLGGGGSSTFLALTDTPSSYTANRIMFTNSGATALTDSANFVFDGTNLGVGTSTPNNLIQVYDLIDFDNAESRTRLGYQAGKNLVAGAQNNTFIGYRAGYASTTGSTNFADSNTGIGAQVLYNNASGNGNTVAGNLSMYNNVSGNSNVTSGNLTLYSNTTGDNNVALGYTAMYSNVSGGSNTSVGMGAAYSSASASHNTALGYNALYSNTGGINTAVGSEAMYSNAGSFFNTAIGYQALRANTDGGTNSAIGYQAGRYLTDGTSAASSTDNSVYLGANTKALTSNDQNTIVIGYNANGIGSNSVVLGNDSITTTALKGNVGLGTTTPGYRLTIAGDMQLSGAFRDSTNASGTLGMVLQSTGTSTRWVATSTLGISGGGGGSLFTDGGATTYLTATGDNLAIGTTTASSRLTVDGAIAALNGINFGGQRSVFIDSSSNMTFGEWALFYAENNANVYSNIGIGDNAGNNLRSGFSNVIMGFSAGANMATGSRSVVIGDHAVGNNPGVANIGSMVVIGDGAGQDLEDGANWQTLVGYRAGENITTGSGNTIFGYQAGNNITEGWENIVIGYDIDAPSATSNNTLNIGNIIFGNSIDGTGTTVSTGNIGIGTSTPSARFAIRGNSGSTLDTFRVASSSGALSLQIEADGDVGIGNSAASQLTVYGAGQTTAALTNSGNRGGMLSLLTSGSSAGDGGAIVFGNSQSKSAGSVGFAAIKGLLADGSNNTLGHLAFSTRNASTDSALTERMRINYDGNVAIGTTTPAQKLQVWGNIRVGTSGTNGCLERFDGTALTGTCSSDEDLKTNINALATDDRSYLEGIAALNPVTYQWNEVAEDLYKRNTETTAIGLIAQEVEIIFPELVSIDDKGYRQVDLASLPFYIIQAIKEIWTKLTDQQEKIDELEQRIQYLESLQQGGGGGGGGESNPPPAPPAPTVDEGGVDGGGEDLPPEETLPPEEIPPSEETPPVEEILPNVDDTGDTSEDLPEETPPEADTSGEADTAGGVSEGGGEASGGVG